MSDYTDAVEAGLKGIDAPSVGVCPGCEQCRDDLAPDMSMEEFEEAWQSGDICDEASFSYSGCGICGTRLGGDRYVWHWLDDNNNIIHEDDCCVDCALFMANGDEPEQWER
jgi:hypothetical protein